MKVTKKFQFEAEFTGIASDEFSEWMTKVAKTPAEFIECGEKLTNISFTWEVDGSNYKITMIFTLVSVDDADYWDDGGASDMIDIWQDEFPMGRLKLNICGTFESPDVAIFQDFR